MRGSRPQLFGHPFSSYTWKATIALDEGGIEYDFRAFGPEDPDAFAHMQKHWPRGSFPLLLDGDRAIWEASIIIEYAQRKLGGATLIPDDMDEALQVRFMDRMFDNHVMDMVQRIVGEYLIDAAKPDQARIENAKDRLETIYGWLETQVGDEWACGPQFTLADCAAAPSLFYADWLHPMAGRFPTLAAYRARLLARPSVARAVDAARPYRPMFPPGAPDRD